MPWYDYECMECGHTFEVFQSMKDEPVEICEKCGKKVRKLFNSTGIIFKGSGFYVNDYKKGNSKPAKKDTACKGCSNDTCPVD